MANKSLSIDQLRLVRQHIRQTSTYSFACKTFGELKARRMLKTVRAQVTANFEKVRHLKRIIKVRDLMDEQLYDALGVGQKRLAGLALSMLVSAGLFPLMPHYAPSAKYRSGYRLAVTPQETLKAA